MATKAEPVWHRHSPYTRAELAERKLRLAERERDEWRNRAINIERTLVTVSKLVEHYANGRKQR